MSDRRTEIDAGGGPARWRAELERRLDALHAATAAGAMPSPAARFAAEGFASAGLVLGAIDAPALLALVTAIAQRHGHAQTAGNEPWAQIDDAASRVTLALRIGRAPVFPSTAD